MVAATPDIAEMEDTMKRMGLSEEYTRYVNESMKDEYQHPHAQKIMTQVEEEHWIAFERGLFDVIQQQIKNYSVLHDSKPNTATDDHPEDDVDPTCRGIAVDLCSGVGTLPIEYAKQFPQLEWHPVESATNGRFQQLQDALHYFITTDNDGPVLGQDRNGLALYTNDQVELVGLSREGYNGRRGKILGLDDTDPHRIGVQLTTKTRPISLKPIHVIRSEPGIGYEEGVRLENDRAVIQDLFQRSRCVDVSQPDTWVHIQDLYGRCMVVTCTRLQPKMMATSLSDDEDQDHADSKMDEPEDPVHRIPPPQPWRKVLQLAALLLASDGVLLQYDCDHDNDAYGQIPIMKEYVTNLSLPLELVHSDEPLNHGGESRMVLLVWKKSATTDEK